MKVTYLYVAGVMDLYTRQIVGLSVAHHLRSEQTEAALAMALSLRQAADALTHPPLCFGLHQSL